MSESRWVCATKVVPRSNMQAKVNTSCLTPYVPSGVVRLGVALWAGLFCLNSSVHAQDMSFGLEDTGQSAQPARGGGTPPAEGPPSEALANAFRLYQQDRYQEASVLFQRVVDGETREAAGNVQKAQFFLGKSLYHLHYYQAALAVFDEVSQLGTGHLFFEQTLQWLAQLAAQLPEPAGIIEKVGRYGVEQIEQFNTADNADVYNHLVYLMGRSMYQQGEFDAAINLFQRIRSSSPWYVKARFFEGISYIRMRRAQPAIGSFRAILDALDEGEAKVDEEERMRDLAWISLARTYYTAGNRIDSAGDRQVDGRLLGNAVEAWTKIGQGSEYWLDSLFEASWALFLADEYSRALGNVHTLYSPYFKDAFYPEALVLKGVVFFSNCQMSNASAVVKIFHERYDPVKAKLDELLEKYSDN
jgi:tetratricopeptide (TPR) repeat protein